jgi:MoaA/NifB/PqqE/SkfB family radical SAM enzyme
MRDREEVKRQIVDGRRAGATRLILSGGEPTIHPSYVDFVRLGRQAGYAKIQTVTNGRMFSYGDFLERCLDAGLSEITFSIHGPNAKIHDALVGTKGAFDQEITGLRSALAHREATGLPIVNVDIVVNRGNVRVLPEMLRLFYGMGVKEFDLLQVVPFGRAFTDGRDTLFYDLDEMRPYIQEALAYSKRPNVHIWMNRFPPQHLEGYEHLIQDPYKLNDEVRGRLEEYQRLLDKGIWLDCREPERCKYCYLQRLCDTLEGELTREATLDFDVVRVDTEWEAAQPAPFGGDPASRKRAEVEAAAEAKNGDGNGKRRLPMAGADASDGSAAPQGANGTAHHEAPVSLESLVERAARAKTLHVAAKDLPEAVQVLARFPKLVDVELRLRDYAGLEEALAAAEKNEGPLAGRRLARVEAQGATQGKALLAMKGEFEVCVDLTQGTAAWLETFDAAAMPARLSLRQPSYERLSEAATHDVDLRPFFARFAKTVPVEGVPSCILGRAPRERPATLDTTMRTAAGKLEIFRYTRRYIHDRYRTKSLRCADCSETRSCDGMHVNFVRAHGYQVMQPLTAGPPEGALTP